MKRLLFGLAISGILVAVLAPRSPALILLPPVGLSSPKIYNPPVTYQFGDPFAAGLVYGSARDTFAWVSTTNSAGKTDIAGDPETVENNSANTLYWDLRSPILDLGSRYFVDLYPMAGYNHVHLLFADKTLGALSQHIFENLLDGFGCFCDPGDGSQLAEGTYEGYGYTAFFPWFFQATLPICNWQGKATSQGLTKAPCPGYNYGRIGVIPHDGNEMYMMTVKNSRDNGKTFAAFQPFTMNNITTGSGGDLEIYVFAPDYTYHYFGPIAPNTTWAPATPQPALEIFFHDFQSGTNINGAPAPDHQIISVNFQVAS